MHQTVTLTRFNKHWYSNKVGFLEERLEDAAAHKRKDTLLISGYHEEVDNLITFHAVNIFRNILVYF